METWGILGLKSSKNMVLIGTKAMGGGGALAKAPKEKWGEMGENGGKWGKWGKVGGNGGEWGKVWEILDARWKNGEFWG